MDLEKIRKEIDEIDKAIVEYFNKRMRLVKQIAQYKKQNGMNISDKSREKEVLNNVTSLADEGVKEYCKSLFSVLIEISKTYQEDTLH